MSVMIMGSRAFTPLNRQFSPHLLREIAPQPPVLRPEPMNEGFTSDRLNNIIHLEEAPWFLGRAL